MRQPTPSTPAMGLLVSQIRRLDECGSHLCASLLRRVLVDRTGAQICYGVYLVGDILAHRIQIARDVFHVTLRSWAAVSV